MCAKRKKDKKKRPWWGWTHTGTTTAICAGIGMAVAGPFGAAIGLGIGLIVSWAMRRYYLNNYGIYIEDDYKSSKSKNTKPEKKYLGNSNTMELHDLSKIQDSCRIDLMKDEHKAEFTTKESALSSGYNGCRWCMEEYHTD